MNLYYDCIPSQFLIAFTSAAPSWCSHHLTISSQSLKFLESKHNSQSLILLNWLFQDEVLFQALATNLADVVSRKDDHYIAFGWCIIARALIEYETSMNKLLTNGNNHISQLLLLDSRCAVVFCRISIWSQKKLDIFGMWLQSLACAWRVPSQAWELFYLRLLDIYHVLLYLIKLNDVQIHIGKIDCSMLSLWDKLTTEESDYLDLLYCSK